MLRQRVRPVKQIALQLDSFRSAATRLALYKCRSDRELAHSVAIDVQLPGDREGGTSD